MLQCLKTGKYGTSDSIPSGRLYGINVSVSRNPLSPGDLDERPNVRNDPEGYLVIVMRYSGSPTKSNLDQSIARARRIAESFIKSHHDYLPRKIKILLRMRRKSYTTVNNRKLHDMEILKTVFAACSQRVVIAMAGVDNFIANARSFARFFQPIRYDRIELAVAWRDGQWQTYAVKDIIRTIEEVDGGLVAASDLKRNLQVSLLDSWNRVSLSKLSKTETWLWSAVGYP